MKQRIELLNPLSKLLITLREIDLEKAKGNNVDELISTRDMLMNHFLNLELALNNELKVVVGSIEEEYKPKDGDVLIAIADVISGGRLNTLISHNKKYIVLYSTEHSFRVMNDAGDLARISYYDWKKFFKLKEERPISTDGDE